jgi:hypothetical protein
MRSLTSNKLHSELSNLGGKVVWVSLRSWQIDLTAWVRWGELSGARVTVRSVSETCKSAAEWNSSWSSVRPSSSARA